MAKRVVHFRAETRSANVHFVYRAACGSYFAESEHRFVSPDAATATCTRCKRAIVKLITKRLKS